MELGPAALDQPLLIEVSWEVCNQVGGIYTVLRTKAQAITEKFGSNYILIGPYERENALLEFEEAPAPDLIREVFDSMAVGARCHWGRWLVAGEPHVILIDSSGAAPSLSEHKLTLWEEHNISTVQSDPLVDEAISFGFCVAELVRELAGRRAGLALVHVHEWLAGVTVLRLAQLSVPNVRTIFTTHATLIGRYEAGNNVDFYRRMEVIDPEERASYYGINGRHGIERESARRADVFTTVSEVTGRESALFLGRAPDSITPNGLNAHRFTALHEFQNLHLTYKNELHEFVMGHFFPSYTFDLDCTLYIFTSGRYEYRNKGLDVFIEALAILRDRLRRLANAPTVVAFIITRADVTSAKAEVLRGQLMFTDLKVLTQELNARIGERLLASIVKGEMPAYEQLLPPDAAPRIKRACHAFKRQSPPSVVTHELVQEAHDPVLQQLRALGLQNAAEDRVKVIFHPEFITATSPLFSLDYDQFVRGCHMGVFPSYYEPWGYTPLECLALGIPTVTTDLTGFGSFVRNSVPNAWEQGVAVLNRSTRDDSEVAADLATHLFKFCQLSRRERIDMRNRAERLTETFDWSVLANYYFRVYDRAAGGASAPRSKQVNSV